jgi:hypothetical protein
MTSYKLAMIWLSGDLPFRPRWLAKEFVLRAALADPVKAAEIVAELNDGSRHPSCGKTFALHLAEYRRAPAVWRATERGKCAISARINHGLGKRQRSPYLHIPFPAEAA